MKSAIFAALIFLTAFQPAEAIEVGRIGNKSGGAIVFTSELCKADPDKFFAYAYSGGGTPYTGCWVVINKEIFMRWQDGDVRAYPLNALEISDEFQRAMDRQNRKEM